MGPREFYMQRSSYFNRLIFSSGLELLTLKIALYLMLTSG